MSDAGLWAWLLFESGLGTERAKQLLATGHEYAWSLEEILERASTDRTRLGLTAAEARRLSPPGLPPAVDALTWEDALYPVGLNRLTLRLRPALLFYEGDPTLLARSIVYLAPAELEGTDAEALRETVNLLIGEDLLFAVYEGSPQASVLLEELAYGQGEAVLFAAAGLKTRERSVLEQPLTGEDRLLVVSPLPLRLSYRPTFTPVLQQVAAAAADRMILSGYAAQHPQDVIGLDEKPALALAATPPRGPYPPNVQVTTAGTEALSWLAPGVPPDQMGTKAEAPQGAGRAGAETYGLSEIDLGPPPSTKEILETLSQGGQIPEILRKALSDQSG